MPKKTRRKNNRKKSRTRKKRGAVKFGKNKTTDDIVKKGRKILLTTPKKKYRDEREKQIKLTGEKEFALFKKQAMDRMKIAFYKSFKELPSDNDRKILSLVYKGLKQQLSKQENEIIQDYRLENNKNKRKLVWMHNSLRQLREESVKRKHQIYNTGDDPEALIKFKPRKRQRRMGAASGRVIDTSKYMSPVKGDKFRYIDINFDAAERARESRTAAPAKSHKNLFNKKKHAGRKKKTRKKKKRRKKKTRNKKGKGTKFSKNDSKKSYKKLDDDEELSNERMKELTKALGMQNQGIKELKDIIKQNYEKDDGSLDTNKLNDDLKEFGFKTDMEKFVEDLQKQDK